MALHRGTMDMRANVTAFFEERTCTVTYVVADPGSAACAVIDSVLDYDAASGRTSTSNADKVLAFIRDNELEAKWILETHAHADHLTAARYLRENLGAKTGIGGAAPPSLLDEAVSYPDPRNDRLEGLKLRTP